MVNNQDADEPVSLNEDEIAALNRGQMPEERFASILRARQRRRAGPVSSPEETAIGTPVEIRADELEAVAAGREVESVAARIEKASRGT